jgi:hypothetical protein
MLRKRAHLPEPDAQQHDSLHLDRWQKFAAWPAHSIASRHQGLGRVHHLAMPVKALRQHAGVPTMSSIERRIDGFAATYLCKNPKVELS